MSAHTASGAAITARRLAAGPLASEAVTKTGKRQSRPRAANPRRRGSGEEMAGKEIGAHPALLLGLIGAPIGHSASPAMHEAAAAELGIRAYYHAGIDRRARWRGGLAARGASAADREAPQTNSEKHVGGDVP
jgi:hypothetical protein